MASTDWQVMMGTLEIVGLSVARVSYLCSQSLPCTSCLLALLLKTYYERHYPQAEIDCHHGQGGNTLNCFTR